MSTIAIKKNPNSRCLDASKYDEAILIGFQGTKTTVLIKANNGTISASRLKKTLTNVINDLERKGY